MSMWRTGVSMTGPGAAGAPRLDPRDDQRHVQRRLVGEHAVGQLAVLAEALAVIGGHDDERRTRQRRQPVEQRTERAIDEGHLAVVRLRAVLRRRVPPAACRANARRTRAPRRRTATADGRSSPARGRRPRRRGRSGIEISIAPRVSGIWSS